MDHFSILFSVLPQYYRPCYPYTTYALHDDNPFRQNRTSSFYKWTIGSVLSGLALSIFMKNFNYGLLTGLAGGFSIKLALFLNVFYNPDTYKKIEQIKVGTQHSFINSVAEIKLAYLKQKQSDKMGQSKDSEATAMKKDEAVQFRRQKMTATLKQLDLNKGRKAMIDEIVRARQLARLGQTEF